MKKLFYKIVLTSFAFGMFLIPTSAHASGEKFLVEGVFYNGTISAQFSILDGSGNYVADQQVTLLGAPYATEQAYKNAIDSAVIAWANGPGGYSGITSIDVYNIRPQLATIATSGVASDLTTDSTHRLVTDAEKTSWNGKGTGTVSSVGLSSTDFSVSGSPITGSGSITANLNTSGITAGTYSGVTVNNKGIATAGTTRSWNNAPGRSIVTGTGATGFQPSATRDTNVKYGIKVTSTASIASGQEGYVTLEIAPTNSATAGDWVNVGATCGNGQTYSLAVALQGIQPTYCQISTNVPAGWYAKLRSVNVTGTPTYTYLGGQEMSL